MHLLRTRRKWFGIRWDLSEIISIAGIELRIKIEWAFLRNEMEGGERRVHNNVGYSFDAFILINITIFNSRVWPFGCCIEYEKYGRPLWRFVYADWSLLVNEARSNRVGERFGRAQVCLHFTLNYWWWWWRMSWREYIIYNYQIIMNLNNTSARHACAWAMLFMHHRRQLTFILVPETRALKLVLALKQQIHFKDKTLSGTCLTSYAFILLN